MIENNDSSIEVPSVINSRYSEYLRWQQFWHLVHYLCGIFAVIAGGLASAAGTDIGLPLLADYPYIWGLIATALAGVITFLGPLQKAEVYKHAYYRLSSARARYKAGIMHKKELLDVLDHAQSIVLMGAASDAPPNSSSND